MEENKKDNFTKNLLEKIKTDKLEPKPRWQFLLKNYLIWIFGALSLLFGSLATSVIIYLLKHNNWQLAEKSDSFWSFFLLTIPYFWLLFLALFILIIFYNFKHTKKGYRYKPLHIIIVAVLSSIIIGEVFYLAGFSKKIDDVLGARAPFYKEMLNPQLHYWCNPDKGRLAGVILKENNKIALIDPSGKYWELQIGEDQLKLISEYYSSGQVVNILGKTISFEEGIFQVEVFRQAISGDEFIRRFRDRPCFNHNCQTPKDLERFRQKWPEHYFQRFPERPEEIGMIIRLNR